MARYNGGDINDFVFQHPSLGEKRLSPKSNEDFTIDYGGFRNNDDANQVTGAGEPIYQTNRVRSSIEGVFAMNDEDFKFLLLLTQDAQESTITVTHINGTIWKLKGKPVGDLQFSTNTSTMTLKVSGGGTIERL